MKRKGEERGGEGRGGEGGEQRRGEGNAAQAALDSESHFYLWVSFLNLLQTSLLMLCVLTYV